MLGIVTVHLKSDVEFCAALGSGTPVGIHVVLYAIHGDGHEVGGSRIAIDLPREVMPCKRRWHGAGYASVVPGASGRVPDVPNAAVSDVALCPEDELAGTVGLVDIELQCLSVLGGGEIEIHVVLEVSGAVLAAKLLPPQSVRVRMAAAEVESHGLAVL